MKGVYVGLGGNICDRAGNLFRARVALAALPGTRVVARSRLYETEPVGLREQPWFLNQVVEVETELAPEELLPSLLDIEQRLGRVRTVRWGPRPVDLDLLLFGEETRSSPALTLPHPRLTERAFVVQPLAELAPELTLPGGTSVAALAERLGQAGGPEVRLWRPRLVGEPRLRHAELDSTNAEAQRLAASGAGEGTTVVAACQTAGRGRQGRRWLSPPGLGLYLSVLFRPTFLLAAEAPLFTIAGAVAACQAARSLGATDAALKWPNDLVSGGRKAGGVLAEASAAATGRLASVVLGIGLNVGHRAADFPPGLRDQATSLVQEAERPLTVEEAEEALLSELNEVYLGFLTHGPAWLIDRYRTMLATLGRQVTVTGPAGVAHGLAEDLDGASGALILRLDDGRRQVCRVGEVSLRTT
ncbi:MAG: biotin--[acetyl-CoA-carboxylase] ligase [Chitinophagales bacterium]